MSGDDNCFSYWGCLLTIVLFILLIMLIPFIAAGKFLVSNNKD